MKSTYASYGRKVTPQSQPIPGSKQVPNNADGYAFAISDWQRLNRFLMLGSEGGTYYVAEHELTRQNATCVERLLAEDPKRTIDTIVAMREKAYKADPCLFALALAAVHDDVEVRRYALKALPGVARIGTDLFHFLTFAQGQRGWGRAMRTAVGNWYNGKVAEKVADQAVKYRQRDGWTHADALRLAHPKATDLVHNTIYKWIVDGEVTGEIPRILEGYIKAQEPGAAIPELITEYKLTWEMLPTEYLTRPEVWAALLPHMPMVAMLRNLGNMSKCGYLVQGAFDAIAAVGSKLKQVHEAKVHPLRVLVAAKTYSQGHGVLGKGAWDTVPQVVEALDEAFYAAFDNVPTTGKTFYLGVDVSGSMWGSSVGGLNSISAGEGATVMAMVTARTEEKYILKAFNTQMVPLHITPKMLLGAAMKTASETPWGGTDCAQPMLDAIKNGLGIDAFVIYTDSETWASAIHPVQALREYRNKFNPQARLIVVGMTATDVSVADPNDPGMMDIAGFSPDTPQIINDFITGIWNSPS
jgi:60 kDa SS-A/Ro ribonucleoprotein